MKTLIRAALAVIALPLFAAAADGKNCGCACCKGKPVCCCHAGEKKEDTATYPLRGQVISLSEDRTEITVKHEAIPDFMPAMTMTFKVDAGSVTQLKPGQKIVAVLHRKDADFWLRDIKAE